MITTKKNLFVVGDSNIYGDEQVNDNSLGINAGVLGPPGELFNFPSTKTYPYFIPDREIKNISLPGLSIDSQGHLYMQMVLPHLKKGDELLMHLPPVTRDSIYYDWDQRIIDNPNRYKIFKKWALRYAGIEPSHNMFIIFCNLFSQRNVNPRHIEKFKNPKEITLFLDKYYWSPANMVNKFKNIIHLVETTSPAKNFYVFQSLNLNEENIRESKVCLLYTSDAADE